jgi:alpha-glucosidase (family GH31 glycosyl hydrolase)
VARHLRRLRPLCAGGALAALALLLGGCGGSAPAVPGLSAQVDTSPYRLTIENAGKPVIAEDVHDRLRYLVKGGAVHQVTKVLSSSGGVYRLATDEPGRTATVTVRKAAHGFDVSVQLHPARNVIQLYDAFTASASDHFLGGGERGGISDLQGQIVQNAVSNECSYVPVPYFESTAGWGLRLDTRNVTSFAFPLSGGGTGCAAGAIAPCGYGPLVKTVEVCVKGARLDENLYVGSLPNVLQDYQADAGEPAVPPRSELTLMKWRDVVNGPGDLLDDIARFQAAGIPLGAVILDNPWEKSCISTLTFDPARFPDAAATIAQVHARGVKFMLWVSPKDNCVPSGYPPGSMLGSPDNQVLNLTNPDVVAELEARLRKVFALGVDGVKADRGDEVELEGASDSLQNLYPLLFDRAVLSAVPPGGPSIFRAGTMGSQSLVPGIWAGDQPADFSGLQQAIWEAESAGMSAFPTWGSDIGGYNISVPAETPELFARWAELGSVSPVMEVGGQGLNATPFELGPEAIDALRAAATLHYELFPYFYDLLQHHQPVLRPLGFAYPDDPRSWAASNALELLVGPDLLAAPLTASGTTTEIFLPKGNWVDLLNGGQILGGQVFPRTVSTQQMPLYVRMGAVLPFNLRTADSWWGLNELTHPGRAGYLATSGVTLNLRRQPHDVQIFVPFAGKPAGVTIAGKRVPWRWQAGPFPGVVVRVHGPTITGTLAVLPV